MVWIIVAAVVALIVLYMVGAYNGLVKLRNKVKTNWAQIDVVLKRRADLIPNLVETVKGYASHEKETLQNVIEARNKYVSASTQEEQMANAGELT
ncbi:MAG: LemA family protein, partial [Coprobacillaceae bacterium]